MYTCRQFDYSVPFSTAPPNPKSRQAGDKARKQAKLGKILDQVYAELQTKKKPGKENNTYNVENIIHVQHADDY